MVKSLVITLVLFLSLQQFDQVVFAQVSADNKYKEVLVIQIDKALKIIKKESFNTGVTGWVSKGIPGTSAHNLSIILKNIEKNIGLYQFIEVQKNNPKNYKNISDAEMELLQKTLGSVDMGQSKEQLIENLLEIKKYISKEGTLAP